MQASTKLFNVNCLSGLSYYCKSLARRQLLPMLSCASGDNQHTWHRYSTAAPQIIPPPSSGSSPKAYPQKIQKLVEDIGHLTLIEVADLNELLKQTLNIKDVPIMAGASMAGPAAAKVEAEEEEDAPKREKTSFTVRLVNFDAAKKVQIIKEIKNLVEGLNLVQAKKFVESIPQVVREDVTKEEAQKLKEVLAAVGAEVLIE